MKERVLSSLVGALIVIPVIYFGAIPLALFAAVVGVLASREAVILLEKIGFSPSRPIVFAVVFLFILLSSFLGEAATVIMLVTLLVLTLLEALRRRQLNGEFIGSTVFASLYIGFLLSRFVLIREDPQYGLQVALLVLLVIWASDIAAYIVGKNFGRRKLAPKTSPNKTVEGSAAGIAASLVVGYIFTFFIDLSAFEVLALALIIAFSGQAGDLFESQLKRWAQIKDSGNSIPGHGGFLDRIDSLLFGSAAGYYMLQLFLL